MSFSFIHTALVGFTLTLLSGQVMAEGFFSNPLEAIKSFTNSNVNAAKQRQLSQDEILQKLAEDSNYSAPSFDNAQKRTLDNNPALSDPFAEPKQKNQSGNSNTNGAGGNFFNQAIPNTQPYRVNKNTFSNVHSNSTTPQAPSNQLSNQAFGQSMSPPNKGISTQNPEKIQNDYMREHFNNNKTQTSVKQTKPVSGQGTLWQIDSSHSGSGISGVQTQVDKVCIPNDVSLQDTLLQQSAQCKYLQKTGNAQASQFTVKCTIQNQPFIFTGNAKLTSDYFAMKVQGTVEGTQFAMENTFVGKPVGVCKP